MKIHRFITGNAGRIEIEKTGLGQAYKQLVLLHERFAKDPELAQQMGVGLAIPEDPGAMSIVQYIRDLIDRPPGPPVLIMAEDDYFLREVAPVPGNAHVISTRAFLRALPRVADLKERPELWQAVSKFRQGSDKAPIVDRPARKIDTEWEGAIDAADADAVVRTARRLRDRG
jgi:hypothetical protein